MSAPQYAREPRTKVEQITARDNAIAVMTALMAEGPKTVAQLSHRVEGLRPTLAGYLRYMRCSLRTARIVSEPGIRPALWGLGADPDLPDDENWTDPALIAKCGSRPAVQIGMTRDPMIEALYGPAKQHTQEAA